MMMMTMSTKPAFNAARMALASRARPGRVGTRLRSVVVRASEDKPPSMKNIATNATAGKAEEFGDLTKKGITEEAEALGKGVADETNDTNKLGDIMEDGTNKLGDIMEDETNTLGDISKAAVENVQDRATDDLAKSKKAADDLGNELLLALEGLEDKEYEFGDISKAELKKAKAAAESLLGKLQEVLK